MNALKSLILSSAVAIVAVCGLLNSKAQAQGDEKYAVTSIVNRTSLTINYEFRWGNGEWEKISLLPGHTMHHSWKYEFRGQGESPIKTIRFDSDLSSRVLTTTKTVLANRSYTRDNGRSYVFEYEDADRDYLVLREGR
jgi:hypothetical protein